MAIRVRAYTSTPSGGPANAAWRYWLDNLYNREIYRNDRSNEEVLELNRIMIGAYNEWLSINYGAYIDSHSEGNKTNRYTQLVFQDDAKATLFLMRFT